MKYTLGRLRRVECNGKSTEEKRNFHSEMKSHPHRQKPYGFSLRAL